MTPVPESVNYHFTRKCNYQCGFCFHTAKTSYVLPLEDAKRGLQLLKDSGMKKINFSGGEPFLHKQFLGELVKFCKQDLSLESVSIISNGSLVTEDWFQEYARYLDMMGVSCDSFDEETNVRHGRTSEGTTKSHLQTCRYVRDLCETYDVRFKLNTVVTACNKDEDMSEGICELKPCRWKVFQCLLIPEENTGKDALRNAEQFVISDGDFDAFIERHREKVGDGILKPESNTAMRQSYLILDEYMRFLDGGTKKPTKSILDVGVFNALPGANFDENEFLKRGGRFEWSKGKSDLYDW